MDRWHGRVALVTGCSSGIGAAIAKSLVQHGLQVVGCSRQVDKIEELSKSLEHEKGQLHAVKCDVRHEAEIRQLFSIIEADYGQLDICVNNAGLAHDGSVLEGDTEHWREMFEVDVLAVSICTREAVKIMRKNGTDDGQIINMNSMSAHRKLTGKSAWYSACKAALAVLTESTRVELRMLGSHIRVAEISPGIVETNFHHKFFGEEKAKKQYKKFKCLQPEDIADVVIYVISAPPHVQVHDILMRATEQMS